MTCGASPLWAWSKLVVGAVNCSISFVAMYPFFENPTATHRVFDLFSIKWRHALTPGTMPQSGTWVCSFDLAQFDPVDEVCSGAIGHSLG